MSSRPRFPTALRSQHKYTNRGSGRTAHSFNASYSSAPPSADTSTLDYGGQRAGEWPPRGTAWKDTAEAVAGSPSPSSSHTSDKREPCNPLLLSAKGVGRKEEKLDETMTCPAPRSWIISFHILMFKYR